MITGAQCHAARALVEISRRRLAERSGIDETVIEHFERKMNIPGDQTVAALKAALEEIGAVFIADNGGGAGVRLKFNESQTKRVAVWEGEGGVADIDDVQ